MKLPVQEIIVALSLLTLVACGKSTQTQIQNSIKANQEAATYSDWEASEHNPEVLFEEWREEAKTDEESKEDLSKDLCRELSVLAGQSLSVFEHEIESNKNHEILKPCKKKLEKQLDAYYSAQRKDINVSIDAKKSTSSSNNFNFPSNVQLRDVSNGYYGVSADVSPKELVLTFDDGPSGIYTESILRSLREVNAKVIFFHQGKNVRANPDIVKKVAADGHSIGSHSVSHRCLGTRINCQKSNGRLLTFDEAVAEVKGGHQAVADVLGWVDPFFRFPFGENSPELKSFLRSKSVGEFYWSIDSEDWKAQSNENLLRNTLEQIDKRGRGMVLFHDIQRKTAETLPAFLRAVYSRGYSIVLLKAADENARYNSKLVNRRQP